MSRPSCCRQFAQARLRSFGPTAGDNDFDYGHGFLPIFAEFIQKHPISEVAMMPYNGITGIGQLAKNWLHLCNAQGSWTTDQNSHSYAQSYPP